MTKQRSSPFAALDTALLRETQTDGAEGASRARGRSKAPEDPVIATRRALSTTGKEIYYVRVTPAEKQAVADLIHAFGQRGIRTSVTEIGRIALHQLLAEYEARGTESFLSRVL